VAHAIVALVESGSITGIVLPATAGCVLPERSGSTLRGGMMGGEGRAVEPFDPTRPNIARVWDYWLGGKDNFAADRELAQKMLVVHPPSAQMARENRQFLGRAAAMWRPAVSASSSTSAPACRPR